ESLKEYAIELENEGSIELAVEQEQVWDILMQVLDQIASTLGERRVSPKRLIEIFDLVVSTQSLGKLPDGFDEVYICNADRIQTKTAKVVFLLGANTGVFPQTYSDSGLFGDFEKSRMQEILPDIKDDAKQAAIYERFLVYNSVCSAREKLFVTYALSASTGEKLTVSEIVSVTCKILPQCNKISTAEQPTEQLIESEKSAFELMAKKWHENSEEENTLKAYFNAKPEYKGRMQALERAAERKEFIFENSAASKELFGKYMNLSASRIEDYERCPFMYFCKSGLRARPRSVARLDPLSSGNIVHFVLEKLLKNHENGEAFSLSAKELDDEIERLLQVYIETYMGGSADKSQRFNYLYSRMLKILRTIVSRLICEFENSDFVPCDFELKIDRDGEVKPFKVELEDGYVQLRGKVDRVDKMESGGKRYIRVVDYKTGSKAFSLSDVMSGLGMQMLLYLVSIWRGGKEHYGGSVIPAGVLYLPARFDPYDVERSDDEQMRESKKLKEGKMSGMLLDDGEVIQGMDRSMNFDFLPIKKNRKTSAVSGEFINLQQLGALAKKMDKIIAEMGNSLHNGFVPAKPAFGKDHGDTCDYCDFKSVCMKDEGVSYRYIEKLTHSECLTKLDGEENANGEKLD
ncbi:MAG: PD-(D/E)XK nuclease family protein, partial [Ruminococcus sp.]|nr:PD-(D/E)XK nuclease family protein [Ruminococcus sp.]